MDEKNTAQNSLPKVTIINNGDLSSLNEKQLERLAMLEKIEMKTKASTDAILEKMHSRLPLTSAVTPAVTPALKHVPIIPPFKADAPLTANLQKAAKAAAQTSDNLNASKADQKPAAVPHQTETPPPPMKKLSADEILALHKKDFTEKRFKPSFISVSAKDDADTTTAPPIDEYEKLARLYYSSEPDGLNPTD